MWRCCCRNSRLVCFISALYYLFIHLCVVRLFSNWNKDWGKKAKAAGVGSILQFLQFYTTSTIWQFTYFVTAPFQRLFSDFKLWNSNHIFRIHYTALMEELCLFCLIQKHRGKKTHTCWTSGVRSSLLVFRIQPQTPDLQQQLSFTCVTKTQMFSEDSEVLFLFSVFSRRWWHTELKGTSVERIISKSLLAFLLHQP